MGLNFTCDTFISSLKVTMCFIIVVISLIKMLCFSLNKHDREVLKLYI